MEIETFRYLLSALIQVFGALMGVYAVFLVLRYQYIKNDINESKIKLGQYILEGKMNLKIIDDDFRYQNNDSMLLSVYKDFDRSTILNSYRDIRGKLIKKVQSLSVNKGLVFDSIPEFNY